MEKRKISYTEYFSKIKEANEKLAKKYGRTISVDLLHTPGVSIELGINWRALGTQTTEKTRSFINGLSEAKAIVESLNEEFKDCEVE